MQRIQYIKDYKNKKVGEVDSVSNNIAHGLINNGIAILFRNKIFRSPIDKMMRTEIKEKIEETRAERRERLKKEKSEQEYTTK